MKEDWRLIPITWGYYEASNLGRIRRNMPGKGTYVGRIVKQYRNPTSGYMQVDLSINRIQREFQVHKLIADTFCQKRNQEIQVNHKNGDKEDNQPVNLEYLTAIEHSGHTRYMNWLKDKQIYNG